MSLVQVARKEFEDAIRSLTLLGMTLLLSVTLLMLLYFQLHISRETQLKAIVTPHGIMGWIIKQLYLLIPVLGVFVGYKTVVAERESGSIRLLLALPHSRRDVILGKFVGRSAVVVVAVLLAFTVVGTQFAMTSPLFSLSVYAFAALKTALVGIMFVAIAVAFSAMLRSSMMAMWGATGLMLLFVFLWDSVLTLVKSFLESSENITHSGRVVQPDWFYLLKRLNPRHAFTDVTPHDPSTFYLEPWFGGVILVVWLVGPLNLACLQFQRSDLA